MTMTTSVTRDQSGRLPMLPSLAGLRFIAAIVVFLNHIIVSSSPIAPVAPLTPFADPELNKVLVWILMPVGYTAVSFFFVLTGFVITWSSRPGERPTAFWRRRALKIYPNHIVMFALTMILYAGATTTMSSWLPNLLLIQSFFPSISVFFSVNEPSWALSCDLLFYLLFPLLVVLVRKIADRHLWLWVAGAVLATLAMPVIGNAILPSEPKLFGSPISVSQLWFGFIFPPTQLLVFVLGMLLARIVMTGRWPAIGVPRAIMLMVAGYALSQIVPLEYQFIAVTIVPVAVLVATVAAADVTGRKSWLGSSLMGQLGDVSFGFYICQGVLLYYLRWLIGPDQFFSVPAGIAVLLGLLLVNLVGGWLLFVGLERPIMRRWGRSKRDRRAQTRTSGATP